MAAAALVRAEGVGAGDIADVRTWRRRIVNWLVPAAAAATAVALWVIVPGQRTSAPEEAALDRQIAPGSPAPAVEARAGQTPQGSVDALRDQSAPNYLSRRQVTGQRALKAEESRSREAESGGPPREAAPATVPGDLQVSGQSPQNDAGRRETIQETVTVEEPGRSAPTAPAASSAGFQARVASGSFEVVSPNPQVRWRIGPGSVVQHSANGGMTWATQQTGAITDLTAGSSPSTDVCWLVGRAGLVLRTTDAGRQWQRVPFPETVDIIVVTASNALNATISSADGRRFQTTDGGGTWTTVQ
jgi:hypothetical protein